MSRIQVQNLSFTYPGSWDAVFENVSFEIDTAWKLGFVGRNGKGKTTFLRLLQGQLPYSGTIGASTAFSYFPFAIETPDLTAGAVAQAIAPGQPPWKWARELSLLGTGEEILERRYSALSGGEQTKLQLAALFLQPGAFLLIDEPTNHLDALGRRLVAAYLQSKQGFILVSHDRAFLDRCCDHILALNRNTIEVMSGNFSTWWAEKQKRDAGELAQNQRLQKNIKRLSAAAKRAAAWADKTEAGKWAVSGGEKVADKGFVGHKAAKMMKRAKHIEQRREDAADAKKELLKDLEETERLKLFPQSHPKKRLVWTQGFAADFGCGPVSAPVSFTLEQGQRLAVRGGNGSGKTSLLRAVAGEAVPHSGILETAAGLIVSYLPQDSSFLKGNLDDFIAQAGADKTLFKAILRKLDFERAQFGKDMAGYSAGQKKKVLLAKSLCDKAHLYIWDEPLNYIDLFSRMQIEQLLLQFTPTLLFVEHDETFCEKVATDFLDLQAHHMQ